MPACEVLLARKFGVGQLLFSNPEHGPTTSEITEHFENHWIGAKSGGCARPPALIIGDLGLFITSHGAGLLNGRVAGGGWHTAAKHNSRPRLSEGPLAQRGNLPEGALGISKGLRRGSYPCRLRKRRNSRLRKAVSREAGFRPRLPARFLWEGDLEGNRRASTDGSLHGGKGKTERSSSWRPS